MTDRRMPEPRSPFTDAFKQEREEKPSHTGEKLRPSPPKPGTTGPVEEQGIDSPS
ncbi:hypothetical protein [Azospirillum sp. sgz301742]